jgi:two-component system, NtrC family, sensor kinase
VRKIVNQSQRTRELVSNLLSFAQQSSGRKDDGGFVHAAAAQRANARAAASRSENPHRDLDRAATCPKVWGDGHQLFQVFAQIVENALDALEEAGGGLLQVSARTQGEEVIVVQFSDSGPGIKEPHRVFDPFYTTKPIGKGTGLGLSAVYGVVQDHQGQITCQNRPEGGAVFRARACP